MVLAVFQKPGSKDFGLEWKIVSHYHYDFFIVRWDKDGVNIGQHDVQSGDPNASQKDGSWTVPNSGNGRYRIVIEGCDGHFLSSSTCHQGWSRPVYVDFPLATSCIAAQGSWTFIDGTCAPRVPRVQAQAMVSNTLPSAVLFRGEQHIAVYNGTGAFGLGLFGFFEISKPGALSFTDFKSRVLANNASRTFTASGPNEYVTVDNRHILFRPNHGMYDWGIDQLDGSSIPLEMERWRLARGDIVNAKGDGCVLITNPHLHQALLLDFRDANTPKRLEGAIDSRGLAGACDLWNRP